MSNAEGKNPLVYLFGMMWKYSKGNRKNVVLYMFLLVLSEIVNAFWVPVVMANIMNTVVLEGITDSSFKKLFLMLLLLPLGSVLSWIFHGPARYLEESNGFLARANYREHQLQGVMNMPLEWHNEHHTGEIIDRIEKGAASIYEFSSESFQFLKPIVMLVSCFSAVVYFSNVSAFVVVAAMLLGMYITVKIDGTCGSLIRDMSKQENKLSESVHDAINNISTIITLRVEKLVFQSIMKKVMSPFGIFKRSVALNETKWSLVSLVCAIMTVIVYGTYFVQNPGAAGTVSIGSFYLVISYLEKISDLFFRFTSLYGWTIRRKFRLINGEGLSADFQQRSFSNHLLPKDWKRIEVTNLSFAHKSAEDDTLHLSEVTFDLNRGETIAAVGSSGSGKSTLLSVIRDLYHPKSGTVSVDGIVIPTGFEGISRAISLVQQEPQIFERTIENNITLGAEYDNELVRRYAQMARFAEVIETLPRGYDSMIKEKGVNLSGGQVQRLALTRGLLASHDKDIVLLDEPTSSLDTITATDVFKNILEQFKGKTVISSVHTLQVLPMFDRVFMFDRGRLVGAGTIPELLQNCPEFKELWDKQYAVTA